MFEPLPFDCELRTRWVARPLYFIAATASTNSLLRNLPASPGGTVILTDYQFSGRGRRGRRWSSAPGSGLLFSLLLPPMPTRNLSLLPIVTAVGVARGLEQYPEVTPLIKWPNDLLLHGRKIGGILVESEWSGSESSKTIVGVGLNVNDDNDHLDHVEGAASLSAFTGTVVARGELLATVLQALEDAYDAFLQGWMPHEEWSQRAKVPGKRLWVHSSEQVPWKATAVALGEHGELIVHNCVGETISLRAGDVSIRTMSPESIP